MSVGCVLAVIGVVILRPLLDEIRTVFQIIKSFFIPKINLKRKYGSWAVVTGCTDGIGKSFSLQLAKRGLNIVLISRNIEKLKSVSSEIESLHNVETRIVVADFSKGREIYKDIENALQDLDVGILVNNVGIQYTYPMYFGELPEDELWNSINVNVGSVAQMTRIILPKMISNKKGAIVNLSSGSKLQPLPFMNLYAASKIFIDYYTEALMHEYRNSGLTIQTLCPYYVSTKINHFSSRLRKVNIFVPDADTYAHHALNTLGVIDNTTGYWPHRLQYMFTILIPVWLRTYVGGLMYKSFRRDYLKNNSKSVL